MARVLLITKGTGGDLYPYFQFGRELKARGHQVLIITHWFCKDVVRQANFEFVALDNPALSDPVLGENHLAYFKHESSSFEDERGKLSKRAVVKTDLTRVFGEYKIILSQAQQPDVILVGNNLVFPICKMVSEKLGIPLATIYSSPGFLKNLPMIEELYHYREGDINQLREELGLPAICDWKSWWTSMDCLIGTWPEWFAEPDQEVSSKLTTVGFVRDDDVETGLIPEQAQAMIEGEISPILITHGTSQPARPQFFAESAAACRMLRQPAILVTPYPNWLVEPLPPEVSWFRKLPFGSLMPHLRAVIHHGGIGTCSQALESGIPQLLLAYNFDRPYNAGCLERLGVGKYLPQVKWKAEIIADALSGLIDSAAVQERCRRLSRKCDSHRSAEYTADLIEEIIPRRFKSINGKAPAVAEEFNRSDDNSDPQASPKRDVNALSSEARALLAAKLKQKIESKEAARRIKPREASTDRFLSFGQQRLWFLEQLEPGSSRYNLNAAVRLEGNLDIDALEKTISEVVRRHEALRTVFRLENGQPTQTVLEPSRTKLTLTDLEDLPPQERERRARETATAGRSAYWFGRSPRSTPPMWKVARRRWKNRRYSTPIMRSGNESTCKEKFGNGSSRTGKNGWVGNCRSWSCRRTDHVPRRRVAGERHGDL